MQDQIMGFSAEPDQLEKYYNGLSPADKSTFQTEITKLHKANPDEALWGYWYYRLQLPHPATNSPIAVSWNLRKLTPQLVISLIVGLIAGVALWLLYRDNGDYTFWALRTGIRTTLTLAVCMSAIIIVLGVNYRRLKQPALLAVTLLAYYGLLLAAALSTESSNFMEFFVPTSLIISFLTVGLINFSFSTADWKLLPLGFSKYVAKLMEVVIVSGVFYLVVGIIVAVGFALFAAISINPANDAYIFIMSVVLATVPLMVLNLTYDFASDANTQLRSPVVNLVSGLAAVLSVVGAVFLTCYTVFLMISGLTKTFDSGVATNIFMATILVALSLIYLSNLQLDRVQGKFTQLIIGVNTVLSVQAFILSCIASWVLISRIASYGWTLDRLVGVITLSIYFVMLIGHAASVGWLLSKRDLSRYLVYLRTLAVSGLALLGVATIVITVLDAESITIRQQAQSAIASDGAKALDKSFFTSSPLKSVATLQTMYLTATRNAKVDIVMTMTDLGQYYLISQQPIVFDALQGLRALEPASDLRSFISVALDSLTDYDKTNELRVACAALFKANMTQENIVCSNRFALPITY